MGKSTEIIIEIPEEPMISWEELRARFPQSSGYFQSKENWSGLVFEDRRLLFPDEKIELLGGLDKVQANFSDLPKRTAVDVAMLRACEITPATFKDVIEFCKLVEVINEDEFFGLIFKFQKLLNVDPAIVIPKFPIDYIRKSSQDPMEFVVKRHAKPGFQTTEWGMRSRTLKNRAETVATEGSFWRRLIPGGVWG